jgi:hypothetical protein
MKKRLIRKRGMVGMLAVSLTFGCAELKEAARQDDGPPAPYYLGMTFDELAEMDLYNTPFQITAQYDIEDGPEAGGRAVWMSGTCLLFDSGGILRSISEPRPRLPPPRKKTPRPARTGSGADG